MTDRTRLRTSLLAGLAVILGTTMTTARTMDADSHDHLTHGERSRARRVLGGAVGALVGAIAAVNIVIFSGIEDGYEATPAQVFDESPVVGIIAALAFCVCIGIGALVAGRSSKA